MGIFDRLKGKKPQETGGNMPVPRHIAVIMDGNGRWAKKRGLPRKAGHKVGAETFRTIATYCKDIGVQYFTVYAFSTENWKRPQDEVDALMNLFRTYLREAVETMVARGVAVRVLGDLSVLPEDIRRQIDEVHALADTLGEMRRLRRCASTTADVMKSRTPCVHWQNRCRTERSTPRTSPRTAFLKTCIPHTCPTPI